MSYEIHLVDSTNSVQLDTENIDMTTTFSVADIKDISARKDSITKQVNFKGTKTNNIAFGSMFHFNRVSSNAIANKIGFNYSSLRPVDCLVYEDGILLLKGSLRVMEIATNKGNLTYATVITGKFIEFKGLIQDKLLTDIDFTDLQHRYSKENIKAAWAYTCEVYNSTTSTFSNVVYQNGNNYVYPYIDYAQKFLINDSNATNSDHTKFHALNFRPAVFVKEYFKRIFSAAGWSYEVKGSLPFISRFNAAFVPHSAEKLQYSFSGFNLHFAKPLVVNETQSGSQFTSTKTGHLLTINNFTPPTGSSIAPFVTVQSTKLLNVNRDVVADAQVTVNLSGIHNGYPATVKFFVQLVERPASSSTEQINDWTVIGENSFTLLHSQTIASKLININIGERQYTSNTNLAVRIYLEYPFSLLSGALVTYSADTVSFDIPKNSNTVFTAGILLKDSDYDIIAPTAPENIKQFDFIKSVMGQFNMYGYTENSNPKHLIFQTYDEYYALTSADIIKTTALNWTNKLNHESIKKVPNLTLPKNYKITYKDDSDWINAEYKKNHGITYGTFQFTDAAGLGDTKTVELIFSPTPVIEPVGTQRLQAALYQLDGGNTKAAKTNIRILYYNGVSNCSSYSVLKDKFTTVWTTQEVYPPSTLYPKATTFYYVSDVPVEDLNFGRSKEYYFPATVDYINASTAYASYYANQITELTNINVYTIEADVKLNEIDISNLDLKVPVFIDFGEYGHSYFKVLSVEYQNNKLLSKVVLQQIYLGTLS